VFGKSWARISAGIPVILAKVLRYFVQPFQESAGLVPRLGHDRFLTNSHPSLILPSVDVVMILKEALNDP
jgi:hypothetical protein